MGYVPFMDRLSALQRGEYTSDAERVQSHLGQAEKAERIEIVYDTGRWSVEIDLECPKCAGPAKTAWVEASTLPDLLCELARVIPEHRERLRAECRGEGHI